MNHARILARPIVGAAALGAAALGSVVTLAPTSSAAPAESAPLAAATCWATHYGPMPAGALTASGEVFDNNANTTATSLTRNPQLPFGTRVKVTNVANGESLVVRINDRGTFQQTPQEPKCLDLTDGAFSRLGGSLDPDAGHIVVTQEVLS
ncbi:septal ring lytic transglycosylase RlpA family protein [Streptomyces sp. NPDC020801]|uniref:septal ring lytic transglycosylase RlpA family protein n=1 Tax=unclassified Streptomyces TaxID=2593676 RepID=UPI0037875ADE